ncbi:DUF4199 domain-containing protein [Aquimarina aquimarini]|uniref:DUF4199 domain-containing protein n=1 Tax=Aquimarina aquimarini TaxID=1191734 RepID=UPI000D54E9DB|nr:DUF4199 domain-containing protein [Aquimarina aquimarini]
MENDKAPAKKTMINYGVILGILSTALGVLIYIMDGYTEPNWIHNVIGIAILIGVIIYGIKAYKTVNAGFLNLTEALKVGIGIALIGGIIYVLWILILMILVEPDIISQINELQRAQTIEQYPDMSEEQLNQTLEIAKKFTTPYMIAAIALIGNLFFGFIISLIGGLIMQKKQELH